MGMTPPAICARRCGYPVDMPVYEYVCRKCGHRLEEIQAMGSGPPGPCPECGGGLRRVYGRVGDPFHGDPELPEPTQGPSHEARRRLLALIGMNLDVSQAGPIVDRDVQVVVPHSLLLAPPGLCGTTDRLPASSVGDPALLLHIDV